MYPIGQESYPVPRDDNPKLPSIEERLARAMSDAEERLAAAKEAQELCARNPDLVRLLNLVQRLL